MMSMLSLSSHTPTVDDEMSAWDKKVKAELEHRLRTLETRSGQMRFSRPGGDLFLDGISSWVATLLVAASCVPLFITSLPN